VLTSIDLEMTVRFRRADLLRKAAQARLVKQADSARDTMPPNLAARVSRMALDLARRLSTRTEIPAQARSVDAPQPCGRKLATCLMC
jgi:hypothetical protein